MIAYEEIRVGAKLRLIEDPSMEFEVVEVTERWTGRRRNDIDPRGGPRQWRIKLFFLVPRDAQSPLDEWSDWADEEQPIIGWELLSMSQVRS